MSDSLINEFLDMEMFAAALAEKALSFQNSCRKAREKMAGVSTPALVRGKKGLTNKQVLDLKLRRQKAFLKKIGKL